MSAAGVDWLDIPFDLAASGDVESVPDAWEYMPSRATADCWYDFGFQRVAVLFADGHSMVIHCEHQGRLYEQQMKYLYRLHCQPSRAVLVRI